MIICFFFAKKPEFKAWCPGSGGRVMMGERNENSDLLVRSRMTKVFLIGVKKKKKNDDQGGRGVAVRRLRAQGRPQHLVRPRGDQPRQRVL